MKAFFSPVVRYGFSPVILMLFLACSARSAEPVQNSTTGDAITADLVRTALARELAGDNDQRNDLLQKAIRQSPDDPAVHWQLCEVRSDDQKAWLSASQVELAARKDRRLAEYRQRRETAGATLPEQVALAQWCRKNNLDNEERAHWLLVLQMQPNYPEALKRLKLQPLEGKSRANEQLAQPKEQTQKRGKSLESWRSLTAGWQRALDRGKTAPPAEVREKVVNLSESGDMLALQKAIWQEAGGKKQKLHSLTLALSQALNDNPHPAAAECLTHLAIYSEWEDVRAASIAGLKRHPIDHYAPLLLASLQSPIEADVRFDVDSNGNLITKVQLYREGDLADYSASNLQIANSAQFVYPYAGDHPQNSVNTNFYGDGRDVPGNLAAWKKTETPIQQAILNAYPDRVAKWQASEKARYAYDQATQESQWMHPIIDGMRMEAERRQNANISRALAGKKADALHDEIERRNRAIEESNARIVSILHRATGLDLGDRPLDWWKWWWKNYNETDAIVDAGDSSSGDDPYPGPNEPPPYKPVISSSYVQSYQGFQPIPTPSVPASKFTASPPPTQLYVKSCFAPGTKVWTQLGRIPIEKLKIGDRVLAQNVDSGELAYKPVLGVTVRPPQERLKIGLGAESLTATPGHPFWVDGKAWQMAKQLEVGKILHTVSGGVPIESIEKVEIDPSYAGYSYNLIVADFNSYFVGEQGILVHDNTPRQPTSALIPGLPAEVPVVEKSSP
jgi:hypothetical protein